MSEEKDNGKIILIATVLCVVIGLGFVFRWDKSIMSLFKANDVQKSNTPVVDTVNNPELRDLPQLPNMVTIFGGAFLSSEITIKEGEVVTFYNADSSPKKVIGDGWQSADINKTGAFAKGDFKKGEYAAYIENFPNNIIKIIVK